ncbi:MAG TPA: MBL fold metallo-hydrolase [Syntrophus sp. (in: bacteria)]|jgi:glyoxylase-like metal-dependent hydrolase (beta-lactamase superfamily II)|nr:MBL fold metallo-hydrolase [Syntrophus sp. (in: bacteria)]
MQPDEKHFGPVWFIPGVKRGRYPYCNSVYIQGPGIIIDPASDEDRLREIRDQEGIQEVWLSHWHEDHFTYLDLFGDVPLRICRKDAPPLSDIGVLLDWYNLKDPHRNHWRKLIEETFRFRPRNPTSFLEDGDVIPFGNITVEIIGAPGHTPGHLSFLFREQGILFLGDYDMTSFGPWYGDLYSSIEETTDSLRRLRATPADIWFTGHDTGVITDNEDQLWRQYENVIYQREEKILSFLATPRSITEIVQSWLIYGKPREPLAFFEFGEHALTVKHIDWLLKKGLIEIVDGKFARA